jgi:uncharacterized OsmC-like protein
MENNDVRNKKAEQSMPKEVKVIVRGQSVNPTRLNLTSGKFKMVIDEPENMGGTDAGPTPIQVLLMALAGCLNVTGHEIARQRGLKLNGMKIKIEGNMNPFAFMGISYEERAGFQQISVSVEADMEGASQEELESWLEETEKRCPVTDNIRTNTNISVAVRNNKGAS